jgi:FlaG/FlaF family flagellin (archaellin)
VMQGVASSLRRKIAVAVMAAIIVVLTAAPTALANPGQGHSQGTNYGTSRNNSGDILNDFRHQQNYGYSFAKGDFLN